MIKKEELYYTPTEMEKSFSALSLPVGRWHTVYEASGYLASEQNEKERIDRKFQVMYLVSGENNRVRLTAVNVVEYHEFYGNNKNNYRASFLGFRHGSFSLPVPIVFGPRDPFSEVQPFLRTLRGITPKQLFPANQLGMTSEKWSPYRNTDRPLSCFDKNGNHRDDGWYTKSRYVFPADISDNDLAVVWGTDAQAWQLVEGVFILWPAQLDGNRPYRLVPSRDFYRWTREMADKIRSYGKATSQGDLLLTASYRLPKEREEISDGAVVIDIDRHHIEASGGVTEKYRSGFRSGYLAPITITHPEHEKLEIPEDEPDRNSEGLWFWEAELMPGTSRPFQRTNARD